MRDLPLTALYQTSALKITPATPCQEAEDSLQVSVGRRAPEPRARAKGKNTQISPRTRQKQKEVASISKRSTNNACGRLLYHSVIILGTRSQLLADNLIFAL